MRLKGEGEGSEKIPVRAFAEGGRSWSCVNFLLRSRLQIAFDIGIFFKGLDGVLEFVGGLLLIVVRPETATVILTMLTQHELSKHPHDIIANQVARLAQDFSPGSEMFAGVYLLSHGVIKVVLVVSLFRGRLWAYPAAMVVFALFIAYQMYRYVLEPSTIKDCPERARRGRDRPHLARVRSAEAGAWRGLSGASGDSMMAGGLASREVEGALDPHDARRRRATVLLTC